MIFFRCPENVFLTGLELGAGDGFQSFFLKRHCRKLISTDLNPRILAKEQKLGIEYRVVDAEEIGQIFNQEQFDLVFSSNLLEHLPSPQKTLEGLHKVLNDNGIAIHVMPSPFWKFCHLLFYLSYRFTIFLEQAANKQGRQQLKIKTKNLFGKAELPLEQEKDGKDSEALGNNPKTRRKPRSFIYRLLIPEPHSSSLTNFREFWTFNRAYWKKEFEKAGFEVAGFIKGPVASGYGFGFDFIRNVLERLGLASEYVYITVKKGRVSDYLKYFIG